MQDRYVGNMNDFFKYAVLRRLGELSIGQRHLRLGVCWYLTDPAIVDRDNPQKDGHRVDYLLDDTNWRRRLDPGLFDILQHVLVADGRVEETRRSIASIQSADLLPLSTIFFDRQVPQIALERTQWHQDSLMCLKDADVVLLDPDNSVSELFIDPVRGGKWASPQEALSYRMRSQSVMWISHPRQQVRSVHHSSMMVAMHRIPGLFCSIYLGHCGFHFLICETHEVIQRELRQLVSQGIERGFGTCRYFDSLGETINSGGVEVLTDVDLASEAITNPSLESNVEAGIWEYHTMAVVNDPGNLWRIRNPWLVCDRTCDVAFLLIQEQRIVTVRFVPFDNSNHQNGLKPLDDPANRARWADISTNASNANLRIYSVLVRQFPD